MQEPRPGQPERGSRAPAAPTFTVHVRRTDHLTDHVPGLERWSWFATATGGIALALAAAAWVADRTREQ